MRVRFYTKRDEKGWVYTKALAYLFSPFFDDQDTFKPALDTEVFEDRIELVAEEARQIVGILDMDIYNKEYSQTYRYAPADKVAYFSNLAVHPDFQGRGIAQALYEKAKKMLVEKAVDKLSIFTRSGHVVNHLYQKWGGQLVCQDWLVVGSPKSLPLHCFDVDLEARKLVLANQAGTPISYYQRERIYILSNEQALDEFDIEKSYQELTYVIDL